jgi:hypothetical protein
MQRSRRQQAKASKNNGGGPVVRITTTTRPCSKAREKEGEGVGVWRQRQGACAREEAAEASGHPQTMCSTHRQAKPTYLLTGTKVQILTPEELLGLQSRTRPCTCRCMSTRFHMLDFILHDLLVLRVLLTLLVPHPTHRLSQ